MQNIQQQKRLKIREEELKKKLSKVNQQKQLKKIMKSSTQQNKKLINEIKQLRDRVQTIMNARNINIEDFNKIQPKNQLQSKLCQEIVQSKKQLKSKYAKMKQLKQQINAKNSNKIDEAEHTKKQNMNVITDTEKNIQQLKKQLEDLKSTNKKLDKTIQNNNKQDKVNQPRIQQLQQQNKQIKLKITEIRKNDYEKEYQSIKVQTTLVEHKRKFRQNEAMTSMLSLKNLKNLQKNQLLQKQRVKGLKQEISRLKQKVQIVSQNQKNQQIELKNKRKQLYDQNKELLKKLKQDQLLKCKLQQQNNLWRKKWSDICRAIEHHNKKIKKISVDVEANEYIDLKPLRKDYAGILNRHRFDDRLLLKDQKNTKIIGMMIYQIERGIVSIQAIYSNGEKTPIPIPQHFIERCRATKIQCAQHDFFKLFKIKYNSIDNKITKVEIRSNKNIKYQYGQKKQWSDLIEGDTIYGFDIGIKQYPVCIFGSYNYFKGYWLLEGFGVEINQLQQ